MNNKQTQQELRDAIERQRQLVASDTAFMEALHPMEDVTSLIRQIAGRKALVRALESALQKLD